MAAVRRREAEMGEPMPQHGGLESGFAGREPRQGEGSRPTAPEQGQFPGRQHLDQALDLGAMGGRAG